MDDHYFLSPNGKQSIAKELSTNDSRVLGAVVDDNWIQYVHHSMDTTYGTSGIYHGTIENYSSSPTVYGKIISDSIMDYGYPNIASTGINPNEKECVIGFNYTSAVDTNGVACYYMDNLSNYSSRIKLKAGEAPINSFVSGTVDRWGDYFGIWHNEIWLGSSNNRDYEGVTGFSNTGWPYFLILDKDLRIRIVQQGWNKEQILQHPFPNILFLYFLYKED